MEKITSFMKKIYCSNNDVLIQICDSIVEFKVIAKIIEYAQNQIPKGAIKTTQYNKWDSKLIKFKLSDITKNNNRNYALSAIERFSNIKVNCDIDDGVFTVHIISAVTKDNDSDYVEIRIDRPVWNIVLNFTRGFKKMNPDIYKSLRKTSSVIFYFMVCDNSDDYVEYVDVDKFRSIFKIENKYKVVSELERCIIKPAQQELDEKSDYSFDYKIEKQGRNVVGFSFTKRKTDNDISKHKEELKDNRRISVRIAKSITDKKVWNALITVFDTETELAALKDKIFDAGSEFMDEIVRKLPSIKKKAESRGIKPSDLIRILISAHIKKMESEANLK